MNVKTGTNNASHSHCQVKRAALQSQIRPQTASHTQRYTVQDQDYNWAIGGVSSNVLWLVSYACFINPDEKMQNLRWLLHQGFYNIIIAQWSRALVLWTTDPEFKSSKVTEIIFWKSYFYQKIDFSFAFCTFIYVRCYLIFHHQTISSWIKKLYSGVMSHLNLWAGIKGWIFHVNINCWDWVL